MAGECLDGSVTSDQAGSSSFFGDEANECALRSFPTYCQQTQLSVVGYFEIAHYPIILDRARQVVNQVGREPLATAWSRRDGFRSKSSHSL
jgi:hypothetical protein